MNNSLREFFYNSSFDHIKDSIILLDIDGTLTSDKSHELSDETLQIITILKSRNEVYLCSNGNHQDRNALLIKQLNIRLVNEGIKKPSIKILKNIGDEISKPLIVIGDKYLTDGLFAQAIGGEFIKVKRLVGSTDTFLTKISYAIDDAAWILSPFFNLMRPWQWLKNLLIFTPLFFAGSLLVYDKFLAACAAFIVFSIAASIIYAFNDLFDKEQDKLHPRKKYRPLASGRITTTSAYILIGLLGIIEIALLFLYPILIPIIVLYIALNICYSSWLKHIAVIDVIAVAFFYLLRIVAGGIVTTIPLSSWIILCTFFAALFIILAKRRTEFRHESKRLVLEQYSEHALDSMLTASAALTIISYGLYTVLGHTPDYLVYSTLFIVLSLFRILNRIYTKPNEVEAPEFLIFKDRWILAAFLMWLVFVFFVFYSAK